MADGFINPTYQSPAPQDLNTVLDAFKQSLQKDFNCVRIGEIQSFNAANQTVIVNIAQQQITSISALGIKTVAGYPLLAQVPVQFPSGGGFTLTFPISAGDECLVLFNDRQLDSWKQMGSGQPPQIGRFHDLSDGIALVGIRNFTRSLSGVSTSTTQLRSDDGTTYIEIAAGGIVNAVAPNGFNVVGSITVTGNMNIEGTSGSDTATIDCNLTQTTGKVLKAGNGATGTFTSVTVENGIVVSGS